MYLLGWPQVASARPASMITPLKLKSRQASKILVTPVEFKGLTMPALGSTMLMNAMGAL